MPDSSSLLRQSEKGRAHYIEGQWYLPVADYHEIREALDMAVYHAENLHRVRNGVRVRDLDESAVGFAKAKRLLDSLGAS